MTEKAQNGRARLTITSAAPLQTLVWSATAPLMSRPVLSSPQAQLGALFWTLALSLAASASAQEDWNPCERFGKNDATFVGQVGMLTRHSIKIADRPTENLLVYPVVVEQSFRGVPAGAT
jgi:hypothetical protein